MKIKTIDFVYSAIILFSIVLYFKYFPFNVDSIWILHCADEMFKGGILYKDITDVNPPLIFIYSLIPIFISKITPLDSIESYIFFVLIIISISIFLIYKILNTIYSKKTLKIYLYSILFIISISTTSNFGEREHLFILFILPYIFTKIYANKITLTQNDAIFISLFAVLGFNLKPHFFLLFLLLETITLIKNKKISSFLRIDFFIISLSPFLYLLIIFLFFPLYIYETLPFAIETYSSAFNRNIVQLIINPEFFFLLSLLIFWYIYSKKEKNIEEDIIFIFSIFSLVLIYLLQQKGWSYHRLPIFILSQIFLIKILINIAKNKLYFLFFIPLYILIVINNQSAHPYYPLLKKYTHSLPNKQVIFIATMDIAQGKALLKPTQKWASSYSALFMLPSIMYDEKELLKSKVLDKIYFEQLKYNPDTIIFQSELIYNFFINESEKIKKLYSNNYTLTKYHKYLVLNKK